jgi:cytosine/adenosine deaminase-related metal-dependent hydrolase
MHVAESDNESEFLAGKGPLYDLMRERNFRDGDWTPPMKSPVQYMDMLGLLTRDTLCVHLVQVSDSDIELLAQRRPRICLCPRSNQKLQVGNPPVEKLFREGLPIALGTDSLASNDDLSILKEMARIREIAPVVSPDEIIRMGTINGAAALNMEKQLGSIEEGKEASLISLSVTSSSSGTLYEEIVCDGYRKEIKWINQPQ